MGVRVAGKAGRRRSVTPATVNLVGGALVLLLVIPNALRASLSPPPAIAEFAPQAQEPIKQAPLEQSAQSGHGPGGAAVGGAPSPSPMPTGLLATAAVPERGSVPRG